MGADFCAYLKVRVCLRARLLPVSGAAFVLGSLLFASLFWANTFSRFQTPSLYFFFFPRMVDSPATL
jgi:hypothetical protein